VAFATLAVAGCGLGPGEPSEGEATLTVTRDYGAQTLIEASEEDPPSSETVIRLLDREAEIGTRFGGGFVHSIDGLAGAIDDGRTSDWFFYVNGVESERGAAEVDVRGGDRIWWDYRDWTDAMRVPAVVGSWPEPFAQESAGTARLPVRIGCGAPRGRCGAVAERLADQGIDAGVESIRRARAPSGAIRILVGPWAALASDPTAAQLQQGPASSGVFATFERDRHAGFRLAALDPEAATVARLGRGAGLVAALREGDDPPTWLVTGTDLAGVEAATTLLDGDRLENAYAVAISGQHELPLPVQDPGG
jgi:hypothetical protein